jgi:hypothetical protein
VSCARCGATTTFPPRPDTRVQRSPPSEEHGRRARLKTQDGKPLLPPAGYEQLVTGSVVPPHRMTEALTLFGATRRHLAAASADFATAERLVWLTLVLRNSLTDERTIRALVEGALEVLMLPRHRQQMLGHLTRGAVKEQDFESARQWLELCDPASEELQTDSAYRISKALLDTGRGDFHAVLETLGATEEEVPVDDAMDPIAVTLRANAWERLGRLDAAQTELTKFMTRGQAASIEMVISSMPPSLPLCVQSIQSARGNVRQAIGERAASQSASGMGWILLFAGGGMPLGILAVSIASGEFELPMLMMLLFPLIFGSWGVSMIRSGQRAKAIAKEGLHGQGRIVAVTSTGTKINNTPLMKIDVQVTVPGHDSVIASTKRLMHGGGHLVGASVTVLWHPKYPDEVVIDG